MCTVSVISTTAGEAPGYRLVHNRDERRDRAPGEGPAWRTFDLPGGHFEALAPRDPDAGGTWIASTRTGLTAGVLNLNPPRSVHGGDAGSWLAGPTGIKATKSRGVAILELLAAVEAGGDPASVSERVFAGCRPCRSVLVVPRSDPRAGIEVVTATHAPERFVVPEAGPIGRFGLSAASGDGVRALCWVSSGLGDDVVLARMPLFAQTVEPDPTADAQDAYHRHRWPDRTEQSVLMSRDDARTVSITTVSWDRSGAEPAMALESIDEPARIG